MDTLTSRKATPDSQTVGALRKLIQTDLYGLASEVLYRHLEPNLLTERVHRPLCVFLQTTPYDENLVLMSRGFFKSSIITTAWVIQRMLADPTAWWCQQRWRGRVCGPNTRMLIASNKAENAEGFLAGIKGHLESNEMLLTLFPEILVREPERNGREWKRDAITVVRSRRDLRESTIQTIGVEGELVSKHYDVGVFDDIVARDNSRTRDAREGVWDFRNKARPLFDPGATIMNIGCLPAGTPVLLESGESRAIEAMKVGDRVWAADEDGGLQVRAVTAMIPQGDAATVTVTTQARTIRATGNHPFLALRGGGLVWVGAEALTSEDHLIAMKAIPGRLEQAWMTADFVWLFGFLLGDGWASVQGHRGHIGIALSQDEGLNAEVRALAERHLPHGAFRERPGRYLRSDSRGDAAWLQALGLVGTAKTKRLPAWAFRLPPALRRQLLTGFCAADGSPLTTRAKIWRVEIANQGLLEDLRALAGLCGVRTGQLLSRRRTVQPPNSPAPILSETWHGSFNFSTPTLNEFRGGGGGQGRRVVPAVLPVPDAGLRPERVLSVTPHPGVEPVYDLTVAGTPSFFAHGLAVHNTPWHYADTWARMKALRAKGVIKLGLYEQPAWERTHPRSADDPEVRAGNVGDVPGHGWVRVVFPERFCLERRAGDAEDHRLELLAEWRLEPSNFNANYLLNPVSAETAHFPRLDPHGHPYVEVVDHAPPLESLWVAMSIDPAQSLEAHADYSAIAVGGFDQRGHLWLLELWQARRNDQMLMSQIYDLAARVQAQGAVLMVIGFEALGFSNAYLTLGNLEGERRGWHLPITPLVRQTTRTKQMRIGGIQAQWMTKQIHVLATCTALEEWQDQCDKFRMDQQSDHDDLLDAVADLYQLRGRPSAPADPYAGDEQRERARWMAEQSQARPQLDPLSLRLAWQHHQARQAAQAEAETRALQGAGSGGPMADLWR